MLWHERGGAAYVQLFAAPGNLTTFDPSVFALVGDIYNGGLGLIAPEPAAMLVWSLLAGLGIGLRWRRRIRK